MKYLHRHLETRIAGLGRVSPTVLLVGARQVGKSTLLQHVFKDLPHITFDPITDLFNARQDPEFFLEQFPPPILLDEIQYTPQILPGIKRRVDISKNKGQYFLTGSQNFSMMQEVSESLAGRVMIAKMYPLTIFERYDAVNQGWIESYLESPDNFFKKLSPIQTKPLYEEIWRGNMPGIIPLENHFIADYHKSYLQTYIERDVRLLETINDLTLFDRFIGICACLTAQEINAAHLAREIGLASKVSNAWFNVLVHSYQMHTIPAFSGNTIKRLSQKPKGYFIDTGLACYLMGLSSPLALSRNNALGALFETFMVNNILGSLEALSLVPKLYHWRTRAGAEVDLILERDGILYPIEIKCKGALNAYDARGLNAFRDTYEHAHTIAKGIILYAGNSIYQINEHVVAIPWNSITPATAPQTLG